MDSVNKRDAAISARGQDISLKPPGKWYLGERGCSQLSLYKILAHIWCKVPKKWTKIGFASVRRVILLTAP